jgi:hypothetical protein
MHLRPLEFYNCYSFATRTNIPTRNNCHRRRTCSCPYAKSYPRRQQSAAPCPGMSGSCRTLAGNGKHGLSRLEAFTTGWPSTSVTCSTIDHPESAFHEDREDGTRIHDHAPRAIVAQVEGAGPNRQATTRNVSVYDVNCMTIDQKVTKLTSL